MTKFAKIISLFLCLAMVFSVAGAMVISSFAADAPQFALKKVSETSDKIVVELNLTSGTFNSLDVVFNMSGVTCESIAQGNASGMDMLLSNPTATGGRSHISAISLNGVQKGTVATITLNKDKKATEYSFSVTVADCAVTDENNENKSVSPSVSGNSIVSEKPTQKPTQKPTEKPTEKPTQKPTQKPTEKPTQKPTEKPTQKPTEKPTQKPTQKPTAPTGTVPTNTLPSSTEVPSTSEVISSTEDTTDFSYDYDDNTYDYYTPDEDETEPAGSDEILDDEKDPKTIIIIAAVAVVLIAGAVVAFVVINKKKNAE